jgi:formate dehydrogenase accessory protein FdhD
MFFLENLNNLNYKLLMNKLYNEIEALRFEENNFTNIKEKLIDDIFLEISINGKIVDKILTVNSDIDLLASGQYFQSTNLEPNEILNNISIVNNKVNLIVNSNDKIHYNKKCACFIEDEIENNFKLKQTEIKIQPQTIFKIFNEFQNSSSLFKETAGVHGAGFYSEIGEKSGFFIDIARHNCIIKATGFLIKQIYENKNETPLLLMTSSRVNSEIIKMVYKSGINILLTRGAPSNSALLESKKLNITLIGFIKENRFTVFNGIYRIIK